MYNKASSPPSHFIVGAPRSGTTMLKDLLNKHPEIWSFGETKLSYKPNFLNFPSHIMRASSASRRQLLEAHKREILTLYSHYIVPWHLPRVWNSLKSRVDNFWLHQFHNPDSWFYRNPLFRGFDRIWMSSAVQSSRLVKSLPENIHHQQQQGARGISYIFSEDELKNCFVELEPILKAQTVEEAEKIYGSFWYRLFTDKLKQTNKSIWIEKTPKNLEHITYFNRLFPDFRTIIMIRDGRDVSCSNVKLAWGASHMKKALSFWAEQINQMLTDLQQLRKDQYLFVHYEDFVTNPDAALDPILDFLSVSKETKPDTSGIKDSSVGNYKNILDQETNQWFLNKYGHLMEQIGYSAVE